MIDITYELLESFGYLVDTDLEGTCQLWRYNDVEYVVLQDNTVITREEDNFCDPIFPY
jgi:hypothetical protein